MKIEKVTSVVLKTTDDKEFKAGDTMTFIAYGKNLIGKFLGIGKRGALDFESIIGGIKFSVSPQSIGSIYKVQKLEVNDD